MEICYLPRQVYSLSLSLFLSLSLVFSPSKTHLNVVPLLFVCCLLRLLLFGSQQFGFTFFEFHILKTDEAPIKGNSPNVSLFSSLFFKGIIIMFPTVGDDTLVSI